MTSPNLLAPIAASPKAPIHVKNDPKEYTASNLPARVDDENDDSVENNFTTWLAVLVNQPLLKEQSWNSVPLPPTTDDALETGVSAATPAPTVMIPQPTLASVTATTSDSLLPPEIISSLTVGTTAPITSTLTSDVAPESDPRLIAAGLSPVEMVKFKDQLTHAVKTSSDLPDQASDNARAAIDKSLPKDDKPLPVIVIKLPAQAAAPTTPAALNSPVIAQIAAQLDDMVVGDDAIKMPKKISALVDTSVDPVELRIAQKSSRADGPSLFTPRSLADQADPQAAKPILADAVRAPVKAENEHTRLANVTNAQTVLTSSVSSENNSGFVTFLSTVTPSGFTPLPTSQSPVNNVLQNITAAQSHPATQNVAAVITKATKVDGPQHIMLQLDPVDLGRMEIRMNYKKGDPLKVHLVVEKSDTLALFQRDQTMLNNALSQAGIKTDEGSLSFELSHDGSAFDQMMQEREARTSQDGTKPSVILKPTDAESEIQAMTPILGGAVRYSVLA
jgi:flagellar hook-length control protein FliK